MARNNAMKRREFLKSTAGAIAVSAAASWSKALAEDDGDNHPGRKLNLLFITADDMNATMPGWMGNALKPTPKMDEFAATSHRFANNRAVSPICQPSRQAIMTGLLPHHTGGYGFNPIRAGIPTLVTLLKASGYFTAGLNKLTHMMPESCFPWDLQHDHGGKNPDGAGREVAEAIKAAQTAGKPFFINCNLTDPHRKFYGSGPNGKATEGGSPQNLAHEFTPKEITVPSFLEDVPDVRKEISQYYNSVQRLDVSFGKILAALKASGEAERTIVIFVSDHGMPFPFAKATAYHHGSWCPVILHWPAMGAGQVREEFTSSLDILPTLLELLGVAAPAKLDGCSWLPLLKGEKQPNREHVISYVSSLSSGKYFPQRVVQTKESSFIFSPWSDGKREFHSESMQGLTYNALVEAGKTDAGIQARVHQYIYGYPLAFYDLQKDPDQRTNAIDNPDYKKEIERLKQILLAQMEKSEDPELGNYKTVLAGGKADITATGKRIKEEEQQLQKGKKGDGESGEHN